MSMYLIDICDYFKVTMLITTISPYPFFVIKIGLFTALQANVKISTPEVNVIKLRK